MTTHDIVLTALFAALIVVLGTIPPIPIGIIPVPITLQSLGVMLAGALLGPWRGAMAAVILIALVAMGLPVLSGGRGGLGVFAGPTVGYLIGFVPAAFVTGWVVGLLGADRRPPLPAFGATVLACILGGVVIDHLCGVIGLVAVTGIAWQNAALGTLAFVPGDLIKAALAGWIAVAIRRVHPIAVH
ncbi:biotin transporter BioY [Enterovirga rhinocerotis]|uniref:Biotin transporter n=1 Tax=Enterovirga rhinocerotis TaxID=1339210 RepID=A0A4R7BNZ8_9HYPH|nr:biotin transporter BioY [Enterovirga rhinocerotis]TDR87254.1 biotin transport system substrate-specific component [Enterovirga rhinocerotis]